MPPHIRPSLIGSTIDTLRQDFASGATTPVEALAATISHMDRVQPAINAIAATDLDGALVAAEASARRWATGDQLGPLDGVPVTVKDSVNAVGLPWRHGSLPNDGLPDATLDAPPTARLREAGAVIVAKTTMPDFGMLASGVSSLYGIVRNPWDTEVTPGGSSSGAGASLAAGLTWGAVGTDIAGSVRLPAAHCGIVAIKPTQGRISHLAPSTVRSAGPMARTVADLTDIYRVIARHDPRDTLSLPDEADREAPIPPLDDVRGLRIGLLTDMGYGFAADAPTLRTLGAAAEVFADAGCTITEMPAPFAADAYDALDTLYLVRARAELEAFGERGIQVLPGLVRWIVDAGTCSATDYERALGRVMQDQMRWCAAQESVDFVLAPTLPSPAFPATDLGMNPARPLEHCSFTAWFNQTGQPAISLPFGDDAGHPVAVQLAGPRFSDRRVLALAGWLEGRRGRGLDWPLEPRTQPGAVWREQP
ncbi:amidase family protein [Gordonia sp. L191]|uniref:amidase family protein n=1 Tax=Gordonia sp. L191 TaxID=2982699 RepID=UPI0024C0A060|nr:amidase family protein [Gordonia sp. L191]WHU46199.1 amidase family protein [Gordonia sp. L191]